MPSTKTTLFVATLLFSFVSYAATTPKPPTSRQAVSYTIKVHDLEKITGKKFTRLQKLQLRFLQNKHVATFLKLGDEPMTNRQRRQAKWSLTLGIASLVLLFIPLLNILAIPAGILAVIFGAQSLKGNSNSKGIVGIVLGGLTVLLFLIAILLVVAILTSSGY